MVDTTASTRSKSFLGSMKNDFHSGRYVANRMTISTSNAAQNARSSVSVRGRVGRNVGQQRPLASIWTDFDIHAHSLTIAKWASELEADFVA